MFLFVEFFVWKDQIETRDQAQYFAKRGASFKSGRVIYGCTRSGKFVSKGCGRRSLKSQGSKKSGKLCTSVIVVSLVDGQYFVEYYPTHYGHKKSPEHLRLASADRQEIIG